MSIFQESIFDNFFCFFKFKQILGGLRGHNQPLFVDGLGLDSIDALELGLAIKKKYGITMSAESEENKQHFACVSALADFIMSRKAN